MTKFNLENDKALIGFASQSCMVNLSEMKQGSETVIDITKSMISAIEKLQQENAELTKRVSELEQLQDLSSEQRSAQSSFGINVERDTMASSIPDTGGTIDRSEKSTQPQQSSASDVVIPGIGPDSADETNLDDLLATDALVATVYNRLRPLKQLKYRLLAMQMGISIERCKIALEKLERAGAVTINDNEIVEIIS